MASSNVCWGVELGAGGVKAVKLESDGDRLTVQDFALIPHAKVLSTPEIDADDVVRISLGALASQHDLSGAVLAVSVPGHQSFARFAKLPPVEPKKVPDIVKFEAVQQIPFPLEDVEWDYQTFVSPDSPDVEVGIFAITRPRIMEKLSQLGELGLTPDIATLSPVAAYNALAYDLEFTEQTPGTIIMDIGTTATDLVIAEAGRVWVRTFPIGGHQFTDALVSAFKLSYTKAEKLKREAEQTKHARHVFQAMRPIFTDLVQEVQRSIGYYQSVHAGADLKRLIGLGATFQLPGLRKYLKQQLQLDVYRMEGYKRVTIEGPRAQAFEEASLELATAYGLAVQGLGMAALEANLMPVKVVREAAWKRKRVWFGVAAGLSAAAGASMFIRPLLDQTAVTGAVPPTSISRVVNESSQREQEAEVLGVLGDEQGDLTAAELVGLFDGREVFAWIAADVQRAFALADAVAAEQGFTEGPALALVSAETTYAAPEDRSGGQAGRGGRSSGFNPRGGRGGMDPRFGGDQAALEGTEGGATEVPIEARRRIVLELETRVSHPDPRRLLGQTMERLAKELADREAAPYEVRLGPVSLNDGTGSGAGRAVGGRTSRLGRPGFDRGGFDRGGLSRPEFGGPGSGARDPRARFGGDRGGDGLRERSDEQLLQELDRLAPVRPEGADAREGASGSPRGVGGETESATARLTVYCLLKDEEAAG